MSTEHNTETCRLGPDGGPCTMCVWAIQQERRKQAQYDLSAEEAALAIGAIPLQALPVENVAIQLPCRAGKHGECAGAAQLRRTGEPSFCSCECHGTPALRAHSDEQDIHAAAKLSRDVARSVAGLRERESIALRNTRSIIHHAEMVEEQVRHEGTKLHYPITESDCNCPLHQMSKSERAELMDRAIEATNREVLAGTLTVTNFDHAWDTAPESVRRVTEIEAAELFYHAGRRDRETEMLAEMNETLKGVVERIRAEGRRSD